MAYPVAADVQALLEGAGIIDTPPTTQQQKLDWAGELAAVIAEWERMTGWIPFIKDANAVTRTYDPPGPHSVAPHAFMRGAGRWLNLNAGLLELVEVRTGVTPSYAGVVMTEGTDFWLRRTDSSLHNLPYDAIEFAFIPHGPRESITVEAKWGYANDVPDDVANALVHAAAAHTVRSHATGLLGGAIEWREADVSERYSFEGLNQLGDDWMADIKKLRAQFKRIVL